MKILGLIPARSGSKGLKDKNIRPLLGTPLIGHTIREAQLSGVFEDIIVSTDSSQYARVSMDLGAKVPFLRPESLATDESIAVETYRFTLEELRNRGQEYDALMVLQPTSPLRQAADILSAVEMLRQKGTEAVVSVCPLEHPSSWIMELPIDRSMAGWITGASLKNRQSETEKYRLNGAIYLSTVEAFDRNGGFYGPKTFGLVMDRSRSLDIDDELDFYMAECLIRFRGHE